MKKQYLFAFDMDGTLLDDKKRVSFSTRRLLKKLIKRGHIVVLASGRPYRALNKYHKLLKLNAPIVCYNGAFVCSPLDKEFDSHIFAFPKDAVCDIYKKLRGEIENVMCETNEKIWLMKDDNALGAFFWHEGMKIHIGELDEILDENPMTMILKTKDRKHDYLIKNAIESHDGIKVRFWNRSDFCEIYYEHISKAAGIKMIADYYNIPQERIIAFGDAENDVEMLSEAGIGVAMKNAGEECKNSADVITLKDNNHNGVYHALKKILKVI